MRINLYKKWENDSSFFSRSFKTRSQPFMMLNTQTMHINKIIARIRQVCAYDSKKVPRYLVVLTDKDYENALEGTPEQVCDFAKACLADEGFMSNTKSRKK